tara:strand:- start:388 stop:585 length:198 start_codon:yes stop_codon:yes gene_type:complete
MKRGHVKVEARRNEPFEKMLKRFVKIVRKERIIEEARERMYYEKPSDKKRRLRKRRRTQTKAQTK